MDEVAKHDHVLTPGRYVGVESVEEDDETFQEKMTLLTSQLSEQMKKSRELDEVIKINLAKV